MVADTRQRPLCRHRAPNRLAAPKGRGRDKMAFLTFSAFLHNDKNTNYLRTDLVTALTGLEVNNFAHIDELMESKTFSKKTEVAAKSGTCNEGPDKTNAKD